MIEAKEKQAGLAGLLSGILAYTIWGLLPLYWKLLDHIPAVEILAHRIFWSFVFTAIVLLATGGWGRLVGVLRERKKLVFVFLCGFIISLNWGTYIYAVNSNHVIEASMGYYINPLVVVLLSITILKESLGRWQAIAIILAAIGVLIITWQYGRVPWIALLLASSFALYGLIKKMVNADPVTGLVLETFIVMPAALAYIAGLEMKGVGAMGTNSPWLVALLACSGIFTSVPLLLYARGVRLIKFSMMGFLQYITPTINLVLGVFVFKEHFSAAHLASFCFIWVALIIFTLANVGLLKEQGPKQEDAPNASGSV